MLFNRRIDKRGRGMFGSLDLEGGSLDKDKEKR